jgi:beta-lactam-binding protein with PASTA domain
MSAWAWAGIVAILLVLGLGGAWALSNLGGSDRVPNVAGMTEAEARTAIEAVGLKLGNTDTKPDDTVPAGQVISTEPSIGTSVPKGQAIDLMLSAGPAAVTVPPVVGLSEEEAIAALQKAGFTVALPIMRDFSPKYDAGFVFQQEPLANDSARKGSPITIYVSKGVEMAPVPYVVDKTKADAITALQKAGFTVTPKDQSSATVAKGTVVDQNPAGGKNAPKGSEVIIFVSSGPEMVTVPDVVTMTEADAKAKLISVGFVPNVTELFGAAIIQVGRVITQVPDAALSAAKGSTVTIQVGRP